MKTRKLGTQGLEVSEIGLGCMTMSVNYTARPPEADSAKVLHRAVDLGITFFDTAEIYGPFHNETLIGKTLGSARDRIVIATKFGFDLGGDGGYPRGVDSRPSHIREVCDASLQRLGMDCIDLFYQHRVDPAVPIEDVAGTVGDLVAKGKVRYFGLSEAGPETIRRAHATFPVTALQSEYSLWTRDPEADVLTVCRELGIGFVAYSPLGRGFLAGAAKELQEDDRRRNQPRWQGEALSENLSAYESFAALATIKGCTPAQLCLAWLLHKSDDVVPIPGTTKLHRLEENAGAVAIALTNEDLTVIEAAIPASAISGARYDAAGMAMIQSR